MANLRRMPYTKSIPEGAEVIAHKGQPHARFKDKKGKTILAPLTEDRQRIRLLSKKWYGEYKDADGVERCVPLSADKTAAQQMLNERVKKAELGRAGIADPFEQHRKQPLAEHLADWQADLLAGGAGRKHVAQTVACARRVLAGCKFVFMADLSASRVQAFLAELRERGKDLAPLPPGQEEFTKAELAALLRVKPPAVPPLVRRHRLQATGNGKARRYPRATAAALVSLRSRGRSIKTSNLYLAAIKQFAHWLVQDRRTGDNPLAHLEGGNVKLDRRHDRRALPEAELRLLLAKAHASERSYRGLAGPDRHFLYLTAMGTGFRASELASLAPESFALDAAPPVVTVGAAYTKNKKPVTQPLPPDLAATLRAYLTGKPAGAPVWPGAWVEDAAEMLRIDLEAAGIPYAVDGADGPLYADFHALRHSYIALLDKSGATLKEAMQLARHSDPKLTMAVYGRAQLHDLAGAAARLPSLLSGADPQRAALAATGTDGRPADGSFRPACA